MFIKETFESLLDQTFADWEAIVIDDGSTDNSLEICQKFVNADARFILKSRDREPKGASACRNIGLQIAKGDFVIFLDSDDLLSAHCIEKRVEKINSGEFDFIVFSAGTFYSEINDSESIWEPKKGNHLIQFLKHDLPWTVMSSIWKRSFLLKINGFNEKFPRLQDVEMHIRALLEKNVRYHTVSTVDCYYRIDNSRIISDFQSFVKNYVVGTEYFLNYFYDRLLEKKMQKHIKYLKVTLLVIIGQLNNYYQSGKIDQKWYKSHIDFLMNTSITKKMLTFNDLKVLNLYSKGYSLKINKIKGYNYIFRKLIQF